MGHGRRVSGDRPGAAHRFLRCVLRYAAQGLGPEAPKQRLQLEAAAGDLAERRAGFPAGAVQRTGGADGESNASKNF